MIIFYLGAVVGLLTGWALFSDHDGPTGGMSPAPVWPEDDWHWTEDDWYDPDEEDTLDTW